MKRTSLHILVVCLGLLALSAPPAAWGFDQPWDSGHNTTGAGGGPNSNPPGGPNQGGGGDPVNTAAGNLQWSSDDFTIPALGVNLYLTRYYNSQDMYKGPFGHGWHYRPFVQLIEAVRPVYAGGNEEAEKYVIVKRGDGVRLRYKVEEDGSLQPSFSAWNAKLVVESGQYVLKTADGIDHTFNSDGSIASMADPAGNQLTFNYDTEGKLAEMVDATGRTVSFSYDGAGNIVGVTDFDQRTFTYGYDDDNNLVSFTNPNNETTRYNYDGEHRLLSVVDASGATVLQNSYDPENRVVVQQYGGGSNSFSYGGGATEVTNRRGFTMEITPSGAGLPLKVVDPAGNTVSFQFSSYFPVAVIDGDGQRTFAYADPTFEAEINPIASYQTPAGATTTWGYDAENRVTQVTDPLNNTTQYTYNSAGLLSQITYPGGATASYTYDANGKMTSMTDAAGVTENFTYSPQGYLTAISETENGTTYTASYAYDARGNITKLTRPDGSEVVHEYDAANRLTHREDSGFSPTKVVDIEYDGGGRITKIVEDGYTKTFQYQNGRLSSVSLPDGSSVAYTYTANDRVSSAAYSGGTFFYEYDSTDRVDKITDPGGNEYTVAYSDDYATQIGLPGGATLQLSYDKDGRLTAIADTAQDKTYTFTYDDAGNRTGLSRAEGQTETYSAAYAYDARNRLTGVTAGGNTVTIDPPRGRKRTASLNELAYAYNHNQRNRFTTLAAEKGSGPLLSRYIYTYPNVKLWSKTIQAGKRWRYEPRERVYEKNLMFFYRSPLEIIK